jgi:hypothetical protein
LRASAEVTSRYEQFSEIIQRTAGRSASQSEKKLSVLSTTKLTSSLADFADGTQTSVEAAR